MKKIISLALPMILIFLLTGCSVESNIQDQNTSVENEIDVVVTTFAPYDWVREVTNGLDNYNITLLQDEGVDLHSYTPTTEDMAKISDCDVFIYVGGESDEWVEDTLSQVRNADMKTINLLEVIGDDAKEEEVKEGMEAEEEETHEEVENDEHVWLSLKNAGIFVQEIENTLISIDEEHSDVLSTNSNEYVKQLDNLDKEYQEVVSSAKYNTLIFGDRFPFRYLVDDYELDYYAAFIGCSAETEASFETIIFLASKIDELNLTHIMVTENSDQKIANTIIENTKNKDQDILEMNSIQSVTNEQIEEGTTYISIMEDNLKVLEEALN